MNYLVISDTHSIGSKLINLISRYPGYQIIHLGDAQDDLNFLKKMNAIVVRGNCDFEGKDEIILDSIYGKMLITHGHLYNVKNRYDNIYYRGLELNCKYILFGHTHQALAQDINGHYLLNPGSLKNGTYILIEKGIPILKNDFE